MVANDPGLVVKGLAKIPGVGKLGEAAGFADKLLTNGHVADPGALDRLGLLWKARGVATNLYNDVKQAVS